MTSCFSDIIKDHSLDFICLQETMKKNFPPKSLRKIDRMNNFDWNWVPSNGKAGGILCGVRKETLEVISWTPGRFCLQANLYDVKLKRVWAIITVYGAAHDDSKDDFLIELASMCSRTQVPHIVGGDFNILRGNGDKNKTMSRSPYVDKFNSLINSLCLREIHMGGGKYTWTNNQKHPTLEKLDRVLMSFEWEDLFPLVTVRKLVRDVSDHNPLLLSSGAKKLDTPHQREFRFELSWLRDENFYPTAKRIWEQPVRATDPIDVLNIKLKRLKKYFKGWGSHTFGHNRKRKKCIKAELEKIEQEEEEGPLDPELYEKKVCLQTELNDILVNEELFWLQQSNEKMAIKR